RTIITVYTAGLVSAPATTASKLFTIVLVVWGVAIFLYVFGLIIELTVGGTVSGAWEARRLRRRVERLTDHVIICGFGRVGRRVAAEFAATGTSYVVVDRNPESVEAAREVGALVVDGDGTNDDDLRKAGIDRAKALVASVDSDEANLFITLSARAMRPSLTIVARSSVDATARKLLLAGANHVVQPYTSAGLQMANVVLKPQVAAFLDIATTAGGEIPELRFEEIVVSPDCEPCGRSIRELRIRDVTGALVVAIRRLDGAFEVTPSPDAVFEAGDILIGVGTTEEMAKLEALFAPRGVTVA
ncbi:MAG TPA: TrkA family potassium uptake protein, partial [Gaiellaceae bacterium]|nr:TrkA family potassium uptake protein [Gaiellaceae bacterium]